MTANQQPNVVVFFTDQERWDSTGLHGNSMNITPNFDRMAMEGTHCQNAFTCQPVCLPARTVMQTGRYASQWDCYWNGGELPLGRRTIGHPVPTSSPTSRIIAMIIRPPRAMNNGTWIHGSLPTCAPSAALRPGTCPVTTA